MSTDSWSSLPMVTVLAGLFRLYDWQRITRAQKSRLSRCAAERQDNDFAESLGT
jgi:hypothetical protein